MMPVIQVGPLAVQLPGLLVLAGVWLGLTLAEKHAAKRGISANDVYNLAITALVAGVIGARLFYVARYPEAFLSKPISLLSLNPELLDPLGGLAAGALIGLVIVQRKKISLPAVLDALAPALAVFLVALALAQLAGGTAFGAETDLPWGIELWGARRHPTQLYSAGLAALIAIWMRPGRAYFYSWRPGVYFFTFLAASAAARLFVEAFRGDSLLVAGGLRTNQILAWLVMAAALWLLHKARTRTFEA